MRPQPNFREQIGLSKFYSLERICTALNDRVEDYFVIDLNESELKLFANKFVHNFAKEFGLAIRTVQPLVWSFAVGNTKLFDEGLIQLEVINGNMYKFKTVNVSDAKITDPLSKPHQVELFDKYDNVVSIYDLQMSKLRMRLNSYRDAIAARQTELKHEVSESLAALEDRLNSLQSSTKQVSRRAILELEILWNDFENKFNRSSHK